MVLLGFRSRGGVLGYSSTMFKTLSKKGMLAVLMISLVPVTVSFPGNAKAAPTFQWDQTSIQGRDIRLLATAYDFYPVKWCLAVDGTPIKTDVSGTRSQQFEVFGTPFNTSTGCWEAPSGSRRSGAFYVPMSSVTAGAHLFTLTVSDAAGVNLSISQSMTAVHTAPIAQWDWKETNAGVATGKVTGVINYGFSTDDPVVSWCLRVDSKIMPNNLARTRSNDYEISDYTYDALTGCWKSEEQRSIFSGLFIMPTQTLKNGPHSIELQYTDRYGESGTLTASFISTNRTSVADFWVGAQAKPYPSKLSALVVGAIGSNVSKFTIMAGYSKKTMRVVKSGRVNEFGRIESNIGIYKANSKVYVQVKVSGINGIKSTSVRLMAVPPPLPNPVPPTLPSSNSSGLKKFKPTLGGTTVQVAVVGQDCVKRLSGMSSDWQGQGYHWTIYYILANGTRTIGRAGFGYEYGTQSFAIPPLCHT
jgi:hypothetical protein